MYHLRKQIELCCRIHWSVQKFLLQTAAKTLKKDAKINKYDANYGSSLTSEISWRETASDLSFATNPWLKEKNFWQEKGFWGSSFKTSYSEALVKRWIRIKEDAIIGSDEYGSMIYKEINASYNFTNPGYI